MELNSKKILSKNEYKKTNLTQNIMYFRKLNSEKYFVKREGVEIKDITGTSSQLTIVRLTPGIKTNHNHPQEQIGFILSGEIRITIGQQQEILSKGDGYYIPSNLQHGFEVVSNDPAVFIEVFSPPKQENKIYSDEDSI